MLSNTEFLSPASVVQGQCGPVPTGAVVFGGEAPAGGGGGCGGGGVLAAAPVSVVATSVAAMNQLGTVYATKRRRRNGKRYDKRSDLKSTLRQSMKLPLRCQKIR